MTKRGPEDKKNVKILEIFAETKDCYMLSKKKEIEKTIEKTRRREDCIKRERRSSPTRYAHPHP
jgi:hypothetical protein